MLKKIAQKRIKSKETWLPNRMKIFLGPQAVGAGDKLFPRLVEGCPPAFRGQWRSSASRVQLLLIDHNAE